MMPKKSGFDPICSRIARVRRRGEKSRLVRWLGGRALATVFLGTALSIGGATEVLQDVHFLVFKDLDTVRIVKADGRRAEVVAKLSDGFAGNALFKLSRILPERVVKQRIALFDERWMPSSPPLAGDPAAKRGIFDEEMARINEAIRRDFFANAIPFGGLIHDTAEKYDVDPALVAAVVETESRFRKGAVSPVGAQGLMQLMPRTGRWMGADNLYDPEQNVEAGVRYIKYLQGRFDGNLKKAIAAYNAGEGNVERYDGVPPFRETRSYVSKVLSRYQTRKKQLERYTDQQQTGVPATASTLR